LISANTFDLYPASARNLEILLVEDNLTERSVLLF